MYSTLFCQLGYKITEKMNKRWEIKDHMTFVGASSMYRLKEKIADAVDVWPRSYSAESIAEIPYIDRS